MRNSFCGQENAQISSLKVLAGWKHPKALIPIFLGCVSNDNRRLEVRLAALEALDSLNSSLRSAKIPYAEIKPHKLKAFRGAVEWSGTGLDDRYEILGRHGTPSDMEWLLTKGKVTEAGPGVEYITGLLKASAAEFPIETLRALAALDGVQQYWTSTEYGSVYDSGTYEVDCSKVRELAQVELRRRGGRK